MTQVERIVHFETLLDELTAAQDALERALALFEDAQDAAAALAAYLDGGDWRRDFEDDEAGRLPEGLKRGVLSEDALYDALERNAELLERLGGEG